MPAVRPRRAPAHRRQLRRAAPQPRPPRPRDPGPHAEGAGDAGRDRRGRRPARSPRSTPSSSRSRERAAGSILTNDFNLNRVAELQGVRVMNINSLANAVKPAVLPGEELRVRVIQEGKEAGQGVGFLDDGTMIVVEGGARHIDRELDVARDPRPPDRRRADDLRPAAARLSLGWAAKRHPAGHGSARDDRAPTRSSSPPAARPGWAGPTSCCADRRPTAARLDPRRDRGRPGVGQIVVVDGARARGRPRARPPWLPSASSTVVGRRASGARTRSHAGVRGRLGSRPSRPARSASCSSTTGRGRSSERPSSSRGARGDSQARRGDPGRPGRGDRSSGSPATWSRETVDRAALAAAQTPAGRAARPARATPTRRFPAGRTARP